MISRGGQQGPPGLTTEATAAGASARVTSRSARIDQVGAGARYPASGERPGDLQPVVIFQPVDDQPRRPSSGWNDRRARRKTGGLAIASGDSNQTARDRRRRRAQTLARAGAR